MRRCTSHTGSSPLWYSTSSTPNSVVPSPKRAMLAREWRSTASNARARTTHSRSGTSTRLVEGFIAPRNLSAGEVVPGVARGEVFRFRDNTVLLEVCNVRSWSAGATAGTGSGLPGPRGAEGVRRVRGSRVRGCRRVHREHGVPAGPVLGGAGGGRGARRGRPVPARPPDAPGGPVGAGHNGGGDRQGAWAEGLLRPGRVGLGTPG